MRTRPSLRFHESCSYRGWHIAAESNRYPPAFAMSKQLAPGFAPKLRLETRLSTSRIAAPLPENRGGVCEATCAEASPGRRTGPGRASGTPKPSLKRALKHRRDVLGPDLFGGCTQLGQRPPAVVLHRRPLQRGPIVPAEGRRADPDQAARLLCGAGRRAQRRRLRAPWRNRTDRPRRGRGGAQFGFVVDGGGFLPGLRIPQPGARGARHARRPLDGLRADDEALGRLTVKVPA